MKKRCSGFTLIELLIVVAIIAILAAIAVPNFLEAQTRAKVSRVQSDLRSMVTAIESYRIDHGKAPADYSYPTWDPLPPVPGGGVSGATGILHPGYIVAGRVKVGLSTPVAYINNPWVQDPFVGKSGGNIDFDQQVYTYNIMQPLWDRTYPASGHPYWNNNYRSFYGEYRIGSIGPDRSFYNPRPNETDGAAWARRADSIPYDPSNGTLSAGNIWRSQKSSAETGRPPMDPPG